MNTLLSQWQPGKCATLAVVVAMWSFCGNAIHAKPLGNATVTQVNNDVRFKPTTGDERPAKAKDVVKGSDTVRTGQKSQAELEFEDRTITRLGSNSTFTFDPEKREFQLKKGLLLFDMPKGAGGGKIITPAGTAAIEGTAGIVSYRSAPKIICLAGVINVLNPNGQLMAKVMPGQLFIMGVTKHPVDFMLNGVKSGKLMSGGLPNNTEEFNNSNNEQLNQIQSGQLQATPFVMLGEKTDVFVATATTTQEQYTQGTEEIIEQIEEKKSQSEPTTLTIQSTTIPDTDNTALNYTAPTINVIDSTLKIGGAETGPSSMSFNATDNLMVDSSTLWVHSGPGDQAGSLHLESTSGRTVFVGSGYDPDNDPDDLLRSHARATINVGDGVYDGGTVEMISRGTHTTSADGQTIPLDGVFIHDATINANYHDNYGYLATRNGGHVLLDGTMQVLLEESVDINANGTTPGSVSIRSSGTDTLHGRIFLTIGDPTGHIAISAIDTEPDASSANSININGWDNSGTKTILFNATGPLGGGNILLSTTGDIQVNNAEFDISSPSYNGGTLTMGYYSGGLYPAANLSIDNIKVDATAPHGTGGSVLFAADNVSLTGTGWPIGGTKVLAGGANGGTVNLFSTGEAEDMVYLRNVGFDAAAYAAPVFVPDDDQESPQPQSTGQQGGHVNINSELLVSMEGTTVMQVGGPVPGTISVTAAGTPSTLGTISLDAQDGFIGLLASTFRVANDESFSTMQGEVGIEGNTLVGGTTKTIQFSAPGGQILLSAPNKVSVHGANLDVSGTGIQDGGAISFGYNIDGLQPTHRINVSDTTILANAAAGMGGTVTMNANDGGTLENSGIWFSANTDIRANGGGGAGTITLSAQDGTTRPAQIGFDTEDHDNVGNLPKEGYVRLTAINSSSVDSTPAAGNILIQGMSLDDGDKSINITAKNSLGGRMNFDAKQSITIIDAMLDVAPIGPESSWVRLGYYDELDNIALPTGRISLTGTIINGDAASGQGASVMLEAYERVDLLTGTDIQANGDTTPGNVSIQSIGTDLVPGIISLNVPNSTGYLNIEAGVTSLGGINGGEIYLNGYNFDGSYSINLAASGPAGGGTIRAAAFGGYYAPSSWVNTYNGLAGINIGSARLSADAPSGSTQPAGQIVLEAPQITLADAYLSANSDGTAGRINISGKNPNGTYLGTQVNIMDSTLTVGGATGSDGGIFITGDTVTIDVMDNFYADPSQVRIQSRENTDDWSTSSSDPIYWIPLYFVINDTTTIDVSGATPTIVGSGGSLDGEFNGSGTAIFDFGAQNVLMWPYTPNSVRKSDGLFDVEFRTSGSFEALNVTPNAGGGGTGPLETARVSIHASGIQIVNSTFPMGEDGALNGPSQFQLFSSTDLIVVSPFDPLYTEATPTTFVSRSGIVNDQETGGKLHLESAGVTALIGGDSSTRITKALVGAVDIGGTVEIISTGDGTSGLGGTADGVHIRNAFIDASHPVTSDYPTFDLTPTPALQGGTVTLDGKMQVSVGDTTDIYADGTTAGSIQVTSTGDSLQQGKVSLYVQDTSTPGHIFFSARNTSVSSLLDTGMIALVGETLEDGSKTVNITASGNAGGGVISFEAPKTVYIDSAALDASALSGGTKSGGTILLHAGASPSTPTDGSVGLQTCSANLLARGFHGGEVTTIPSGTGPFYLPASLEMHGTVVDVSSYGGTSSGNTPQGGDVYLNGTLSAMIYGDQYGSTTINADGPTVANGAIAGSSAGSINISSPGTDETPGNIAILDVESNKTHFVRLSAQDSAVVFDALNNGGNIEIHGADGRARGSETVKITAVGPSGGGNITISAIQNLSIINAQLNAGGTLSLNGQNVLVQNSLLMAALISINASSSASVLNSMLQATSGINISAPTVNLAGTTLNPGLSGSAQIYANTLVNPPASGSYVLNPFGGPN